MITSIVSGDGFGLGRCCPILLPPVRPPLPQGVDCHGRYLLGGFITAVIFGGLR
ncbi:MAG: hypothetical protein U1D96_09885 [Eubacteriales bacterium]|nr:hypothetical protein [Bacillota bacterium]MBV1727011.1 hypothetical protein [Desulforudis sp.]MDP3049998.1 hypothetical protein [Eubacteriales bacterium]MBU4534055.1 hypothetical protein [Bacillota bacterium]MBU4553431.1 hypothetical protein [Bacillota bacterium]